jgi:hypothetical protein
MTPKVLAEKFLDKPRQAYGKHWRSITAPLYWNPPKFFKYNPRSFVMKTGGYIIATSVKDGVTSKTMYESQEEACNLENIQGWGITQYLGGVQEYQDRTWRSATTAEYEVYASCRTPAA